MSVDHFSSATDMLDALRKKDISSVELTEMHIKRIEAHDEALNAIPVRTFDRARAVAKKADEKIAAGDSAPLLGLPMTVKESTQVEGLPQSAGILDFKGHKPTQDGKLASAVFDAGANLLGKTNIPIALGDWQADSPVYGRTNNPWDLTRTPGGSTGGGGAALAAGLTPLEIGSDIGGSIRIPACYCGVYGHRPTETAIPKSGSFPLADLPNPAFLMGVQGPLARTANDLELLFDILAQPDIGEDAAWKLNLPATRHDKLGDFNVAVITPELLGVPVANAMTARVEELIELLTGQGASVTEAMPDVDMEEYFFDYVRTLQIMTSQGQPREELEARAAEMRQAEDPVTRVFADGLTMRAQEYLALVNRRQRCGAAWRDFFATYDILIGPMALDAAFPHQTGELTGRTIMVDNQMVPYFSNIVYPMIAIYCGLPSTAFPAGLDPDGLPLGVQAIGPYLEDRTTLKFAQLVEQEWYKFEAPPGY